MGSVRYYGRDARRAHGVNQYAQLWGVLSLSARHGFTPEDFFRYRLYLKNRRGAASQFWDKPKYIRIREHAYAVAGVDRQQVDDKRLFAEVCSRNRLPTATIVAKVQEGVVEWVQPYRSLPAIDLFVKRACDNQGKGASKWVWRGDHFYDGGERRLSPVSLLDNLRESSSQVDLLVQTCLNNHESLTPLSPGALPTVRVVTGRRRGCDPELVTCGFRMATSTGPIDNFSAGGLAAPVDLDSGALGAAVVKDLKLAWRDYEEHPVTGARISGFRLPFWEQVRAMCLNAHQLFGPFPLIGWDVAITNAGPLLLEGNTRPGCIFAQQPGGRPLGRTVLGAVLSSYLMTQVAEGTRSTHLSYSSDAHTSCTQ